MEIVNEKLPALITQLCCESGNVTVLYRTVTKENDKSILMRSEEKEMTLEGMDECLAKIAKAISRKD